MGSRRCLAWWENQANTVTEFPETRDSLLVQVRSPANREAWDEFALIYRPVIYRLARSGACRMRMPRIWRSRCLMAVASAIGSWEKSNESVRFRHWLRRVARNAIVNALSRQPQDRAAGGSSVQELLLEQPEVDPAVRLLRSSWSIGGNFTCGRPRSCAATWNRKRGGRLS